MGFWFAAANGHDPHKTLDRLESVRSNSPSVCATIRPHEPHDLLKEPYTRRKEPCCLPQELCSLRKEPCNLHREPYTLPIEPCIHPEEPCSLLEGVVLRCDQKRPLYIQDSPTEPHYTKKSLIVDKKSHSQHQSPTVRQFYNAPVH